MAENQIVITADRIRLKEEFNSFEEFEKCLSLYEDIVKQAFRIADSHLLTSKCPISQPPNTACKYLNCTWGCAYGKQRHKPRGAGLKETKYVYFFSKIVHKLKKNAERLLGR